MFYAHLHAKPNASTVYDIFYVGKGAGGRAQNMSARNPFHGNTVAKYGKDHIVVSKISCSSEQLAFELETGLIKCLRIMGVSLTNLTDGGEGISGYKFSPTARKTKAFRATGSPGVSPSHATRALQAAAKTGRPQTTGHKKAIGDGLRTRVYMHRLGKEVRAWPDEIVAYNGLGWALGRLPSRSSQYAEMGAKSAGKKRITDGVAEKSVPVEHLDSWFAKGWKLGRKPSSSKGALKRFLKGI